MTAQEYFKQEWGGFTKATLHGKDTILEISMEDLYKTMEGYRNLSKTEKERTVELKEEIIQAVQDATDRIDGTVSMPILGYFLDEIL